MRETMDQRKRNRQIALAALGGAAALLGWRAMRRGYDLEGKCVLITGGSRGLGFVVAQEFAREGCRVVICARDDRELETARAALERDGARVLAFECDVTEQAQVDRLVRKATGWAGAVDILVNNAGTIQVGPIQDMTLRDFEDSMRLMFWGVLYPTLAVLPQMIERRDGRIVNITSIGAKASVPHLVPYSCAKFAAIALSEGLRAELKRDGIRVTTIVPGLMRTGSYLNAFFKGRKEREFAWFSVGATVPGLSVSARRAARTIVRATRRGESERIISVPAKMLAWFHGLFPGITSDLMAFANRLMLPAPGGDKEKSRGMDVEHRVHSRVFNAVTGLGRSAAEKYNQFGGVGQGRRAA